LREIWISVDALNLRLQDLEDIESHSKSGESLISLPKKENS